MKPPYPGFITRLKMTGAALKVLRLQISFREYIWVIFNYLKYDKKSLWKDLEPARNKKDKGSRAQLGDAIILYRILLKRFTPERAEDIIRNVIKNAAIQFLRGTLPLLDREEILEMDNEEKEEILTSLIEKFPNSDWEIVKTKDDEFHYRITRCRFPELLRHLDHPELNDAFCAGDLLYFQEYQPDIDISRPNTIGSGNNCCDFIFSIRL